MAFKKYKGKVKTEWFPVTTSTALAKDTLVEFTSGKIAAADADETAGGVRGVLGKTIAATDTDYASARLVPIIVPVERHVVWEADASGFTADGSQEGVEYGISGSGTVDYTETSTVHFLVTQVLSATKVRGYLKINGAY
jgi:hypothetical protein